MTPPEGPDLRLLVSRKRRNEVEGLGRPWTWRNVQCVWQMCAQVAGSSRMWLNPDGHLASVGRLSDVA